MWIAGIVVILLLIVGLSALFLKLIDESYRRAEKVAEGSKVRFAWIEAQAETWQRVFNDAWRVYIVVALILLFVPLIVGVAMRVSSTNNANEAESFWEHFVVPHAVAQYDAEGNELTPDQLGYVVVDWGDASDIHNYNRYLTWEETHNSIPVWQWCIADAPEGLYPVRLEPGWHQE